MIIAVITFTDLTMEEDMMAATVVVSPSEHQLHHVEW